MMKNLTAIAKVVCLILTLLSMPATAQERKLPRNRTKRENIMLKESLDSLKTILETERREARERDSVAMEMLSIYEENENRRGLGILECDPDAVDSLLNIWYLHRQVTDTADVELFDMDSVHFTSGVSDEVLKQRLLKMNSYISLPFNETVRNYMILYSEKMPTKMENILSLAMYYMPIFEEIFKKYDLPDELKYLAIIESALNPTAVSRAGATGMWQFMVRTAKAYGLEVDSYVDERRDPFKSADAAARYLTDVYKLYGDWTLAISSYNCGPGNVNKAIRRSGSRDYWSIYRYLPRETRGYMPAFVGAMYALRYRKEYGLNSNGVQMPAQVDTFQIKKNLHFQQISDLVGISVEELRNINPQYVKDLIPGDSKPYILRLPINYTSSFIANEDSVYRHKADIYLNPQMLLESSSSSKGGGSGRIAYKVKKGDSLGKIAARYHVSVAQLKSWNHLRSTVLSIGQTIYIHGAADGSSKAPSSSGEQKPSGQGSGEYSVYTVQKGDSLSTIASKYPGVSAHDLMDFNGIGTLLSVGQKIKIPKK